MTTTTTIRGSWGELLVHNTTGFIIEYDDYDKNCWGPEDTGYHDIAMIDATTLNPEHKECDILSVGYWTKAGVYSHPMRWDPYGFQWDDGQWHGDWFETAGQITHTI